jgi:hypothetical protein
MLSFWEQVTGRIYSAIRQKDGATEGVCIIVFQPTLLFQVGLLPPGTHGGAGWNSDNKHVHRCGGGSLPRRIVRGNS